MSVRRPVADPARRAAELEPTAHVEHGPQEYRVEVDAPGLGAQDFDVTLSGRLLQVSGRDLRRFGSDASFEFVFRLPDDVSGEDLAATFEQSKLLVWSPVKDAEPRRLEVRTPGPLT
jgi:HSP20 family molecular chaperone IbpA